MKLNGIMTALVTPLGLDGRVDEAKLRALVQFQLQHAISGLVVLGGTGEYLALSPAERVRAIGIVAGEVQGRVPLIVGALEPGLGASIDLAQAAQAAGANAVMAMTPYYVNPTQAGIVAFYQALAAAVPLPLVLYNIPYRTGVNMLPETVEKIVDLVPSVVGIKECSPNLSQVTDLFLRVGRRIAVLSGEEFYAVTEFIFGIEGAILATANLIPDFWLQVYAKIGQGDIAGALAQYYRYFPLLQALFRETNPGPLKVAMGLAGLPAGEIGVPLLPPGAETLRELRVLMGELGLVR